MKKVFRGLLAVFILIFILSFVSVGLAANVFRDNKVQTKVLILFDKQPGNTEQAMIRAFGGSVKYTYSLVPAIAASVPEAAITHLVNNPHILSVDIDVKVTITGELEDTWGVEHIGSGVVQADGNTGAGVKVAILDSGIDYNHIDLDANYAGGYDFVNNDNDPMDDNGHGTHVAGTIAGEANGTGVIGVAPDAKLFALKVLDASGSGYFSDIIAALQWCIDNGINVTNNSYSSSTDPGLATQQAFINAANAGIINVASAGNSGNKPGKGDNVGYPAKYDTVIAVAATDSNDKRAAFSSTGPAVEISAPGVSILSTVPGGYAYYSGTSMACPHVVGTVALMVASGINDPGLVRQKLASTAIDLGAAGLDALYGYGLVNAIDATGGIDLPTGSAPEVSITSPIDGAHFISGETISLQGSAIDPEDGILTSIEWVSSINGLLGIGETVNSELSDGNHIITASVIDTDGNKASTSVEITIGVSPVIEGIISVTSIDYSLLAGKHLYVTAIVTDKLAASVANASVTIEIYLDESIYKTLTGVTDSTGTITFKIVNAPVGDYRAEISNVTASGYTWDGVTPPNSFTK